VINRQLVHYDTTGQRVIIQPGDLTNVGSDTYAITPGGASTSVADVPNTIPIRDASGGFEVGYLQIDTTPPVTETSGVGKIIWNDTTGTLEFQLKGGNVSLDIGQEQIIRVKNDEGTALVVGDVVYLSGADGNHALVKKASALNDALSAYTIGIVVEAIANNGQGWVAISGYVRNLDTNHLVEGAPVWLSVTAGQTTSTRPTPPDHAVFLGLCVRKNLNVGSILLAVQNGYELDELHDVLISSPTTGQALVYDGVAGLWKNASVSASDPTKLPLAGGNMTGDLTTSAGVRLGLGTLTPQYAIHAQATGETQLFAGTGFTPALSSSSDPNLLFGYGGSGFRFGGAGTGLSYNQAQIDLTSAQTIRMYTGAGTIAPTERVQITSAGQLQVLGSGGPAITSANTVVVRAPVYPYLHFVNNTSGGAAADGFLVGVESNYANIYVAEAWDLRFSTSATERMRIAANGDVSATNNQAARTAIAVNNNSTNAAAECGFAATSSAATGFFGVGSSASSKVAGLMCYTANAVPWTVWTNGLRRMSINSDGLCGIGVANATATLQLKAGTATANTAPLKINSGTVMASPEDGCVEYNGTKWYTTIGTDRQEVLRGATYSLTLTPTAVAANSESIQTFTISGLIVPYAVQVSPPSSMSGLGIMWTRVSASNTLEICFRNFTAGSLTPPTGTWRIMAARN